MKINILNILAGLGILTLLTFLKIYFNENKELSFAEELFNKIITPRQQLITNVSFNGIFQDHQPLPLPLRDSGVSAFFMNLKI
jgi:hypothetical protein|tara:strand:- start:37 stop:285 length:249 start_codon:yes stop_codon:yes gene_type:complete